MWQYFWLGQETFEAYKAMIIDSRIRYNTTNPYRLTNLDMPDFWFFPWLNDIVPIAVWLLFLSVLFLWISQRINRSSVYGFISLSCGLLGFSFLFGFQNAFPRPFYMFMAVLAVMVFIGCLATFFTVLVVDKLPYFGCPDKYLLHEKTGYPLQYIAYVIGSICVLLLWLLSFDVGMFVKASFLHNHDLLYIVLLIMAVFAGVFGNAALPYVTLADRLQLDGSCTKIVEPLLKINGPASRFEMILGVFGICVFYVLVALSMNGGFSGADFMGIVFIGTIGLTIIHAELTRNSKVVVAKVKRDHGLWN